MKESAACLVLAVAVIILWGVGSFARRTAGSPGGTWAVTLGVGLAVIVFLGGVLNLAHLARAPVLWALVAACVLISAFELRRIRIRLALDSSARLEWVSTALVIVAATGFAVVTQLPPAEFNSHDDFQKYFAHPVRMLATGTLLGSPLDALGSQTLGGQAFLQGIVLSALPIGFINGVDAVFGFLVLMLMAAAAGWRRYGLFPGALLGVLMIAAVNPQYVNVSGLYLGSILMAAAVMAVADSRETELPAPFVLGIMYAAVVALKMSFALFVVLHLPICALAAIRGFGSWRKASVWTLRVAAWTAVGLAPWVLLHLPNYLGPGAFSTETPPDAPAGQLNLLATQDLYYGSSFAHYTGLSALAAIAGVVALVSCCMSSDRRNARTACGVAAASVAGVFSYLVLVVVLGPRFAGYLHSLRYAVSTVLGCSVFAILLLPGLRLRASGAWSGISALMCLVVVVAFIPSTMVRYHQAAQYGSILAFPTLAQHPDYLRYNQFCLSTETARHIRDLQEKVPSGEPFLAWIDTPFLLDYARNPVVDVDVNGLMNRWAHVPEDVHYVLWQYRNLKGFEGFGVRGVNDYVQQQKGDPGRQERAIAARALVLLNKLKELSATNPILTNDGTIVLFRMGAESSAQK